jgi:hypothetical protein
MENRDGTTGAVAGRGSDAVAAERQFADIEVREAERSEKYFLRFQRH